MDNLRFSFWSSCSLCDGVPEPLPDVCSNNKNINVIHKKPKTSDLLEKKTKFMSLEKMMWLQHKNGHGSGSGRVNLQAESNTATGRATGSFTDLQHPTDDCGMYLVMFMNFRFAYHYVFFVLRCSDV